jgi:N-acetylglucosamine kinase-like BadF-type ATPase
MLDEALLLAVDGGATKTDLVLFRPDGTIVNRVVGGPSNSSEIGFDKSVATLRALFADLLGKQADQPALLSVHLGLAGGGIETNRPRYRTFLQHMFPDVPHLSNGSDAVCALNAGLRTGDGMVLIAGTGSAVFVRSGGEIRQVGGWGHLLSDEGSGYDIGRMGLSHALQALDGRRPATLLTELIQSSLGQRIDKAIPQIYDGGKRFISAMAPLVFRAAGQGDAAALDILHHSAGQLANLIRAGSSYLPQPPYLVVLSGGLWNALDQLLERMVLSELDDRFVTIKPKLPPIFGSAVEAVATAGLLLADHFEDRFTASLKQFSPVRGRGVSV